MEKNNKKIIYDEEEDILFLSKGRKSKSSIDLGDFIIDIDKDGFISAIEILDASKNLNLSENKLKQLKKAHMSVTYKPDYVNICLILNLKNKEKDIIIPLTLNLGHSSIKTEKTNFAIV